MSGSPSRASTALNSTLDASQPTELKASTTPTALSPDWVEPWVVASMVEVLSALTRMLPRPSSPPSSRAVNVLFCDQARARLCTRLVATTPLMATDSPSPSALPPEEITEPSVVAFKVAFSSALTWMSPLLAVTSAPSMYDSTLARTSLTTISPPMAWELDSETLNPSGTRLVSSSSLNRSRLV